MTVEDRIHAREIKIERLHYQIGKAEEGEWLIDVGGMTALLPEETREKMKGLIIEGLKEEMKRVKAERI